ncbi:MAG: hypothetical protein MJ223_03270 [Mycoplasmoidaceae bacterium]|nr:hypothetical protein [Mycoplasmoidaceae bacterium]
MHAKLFKKYQKFSVLTFNDFNKKQQSQLYSFDQRIKNIAAFGPSYIYIYDIAKGNITGQAFIKKYLIPLAPSKIVVGSDFKFGCDSCGVSLLRKYFDVSTIDYNKKISTTIIKKLLLENKIEKANSYLYEPYHYIGK